MQGNINFLDGEITAILKGRVSGMYLRKKGTDGFYRPADGWHRKWTYKIGWVGGGDRIRLVAMTDGMITEEMSKGSLSKWIHENGMVFMTKAEMILFMEYTYKDILR